jgi:hypothetical protein
VPDHHSFNKFCAGFFSASKRINGRIVSDATIEATPKMRKKTSKMLNE